MMATTEMIINEAAEKFRDWGKWGANDQPGTLNYITSEKIAEASRLVKWGMEVN